MFHTQDLSMSRSSSVERVVIPWRGFRCFTHPRLLFAKDKKHQVLVVIPWRGFRCFTPSMKSMKSPSGPLGVVIPWRGFRCFTLYEQCTEIYYGDDEL